MELPTAPYTVIRGFNPDGIRVHLVLGEDRVWRILLSGSNYTRAALDNLARFEVLAEGAG